MGLLEKAFRFKNEINKKGEKTLIDKIQGPAETEIVNPGNDDEEVIFLQTRDLEVVEVFEPPVEKGPKKNIKETNEEKKKEESVKGDIKEIQEGTEELESEPVPEKNGEAAVTEDLVILSEIGNDILIADTVEELYDVILFSIHYGKKNNII